MGVVSKFPTDAQPLIADKVHALHDRVAVATEVAAVPSTLNQPGTGAADVENLQNHSWMWVAITIDIRGRDNDIIDLLLVTI